jgi:hypothetical protein
MNVTATRYELVCQDWLGTPTGEAPYGYSIFEYLDLAWEAIGGEGKCPESFADEATARKVAGAIREDCEGVMPRFTVRKARD